MEYRSYSSAVSGTDVQSIDLQLTRVTDAAAAQEEVTILLQVTCSNQGLMCSVWKPTLRITDLHIE